MIINVISLKRSIDRRKYISKHFSKLGLVFEFVDAIDPNYNSNKIISIFSHKKFEKIYNRKATLAEISITTSHYLAREKFLKTDHKTLMIFEDDAKIMCTKEDLFSVVKIFEDSKFDILLLGFSKCDNEFENYVNIINPILPIYRLENKINVGIRYVHSFSGAVGYLIKKEPAKLLSDISHLCNVADDWNYFSKLGLKIGYTQPMIVRENFQELPSYASHSNASQIVKRSQVYCITFILFCRKHIYGVVRKTLLYFQSFKY